MAEGVKLLLFCFTPSSILHPPSLFIFGYNDSFYSQVVPKTLDIIITRVVKPL